MASTIQIIREYTTKTGRRGVVYSLEGRKAATFIPTACDNIAAHLSAALGLAQPTLEEKLERLDYDRGTFEVSIWEKYGKRRVYVNLKKKLNGGRNWNRGLGAAWYLDLESGRVVQCLDWAGSKTFKAYDDAADELLEQLEEVA